MYAPLAFNAPIFLFALWLGYGPPWKWVPPWRWPGAFRRAYDRLNEYESGHDEE